MKHCHFLLFCLVSTSIIAQEKGHFAVSLSTGPSVSLRKLYQQVSNSDRGELAGNGWAYQAGVAYKISKRIGVMARANFNQNETREEGIAKIALNQYNISSPNITLRDKWSTVSVLVGPSFHVYFGKFALESRIFGGYTSVTGPRFALNGLFGTRTVNVEAETGKIQDFSFGGGMTTRYILTDKISICINGDFIQTNAVFDNAAATANSSGQTIKNTFTINQNVGVLNVTAGLQINF